MQRRRPSATSASFESSSNESQTWTARQARAPALEVTTQPERTAHGKCKPTSLQKLNERFQERVQTGQDSLAQARLRASREGGLSRNSAVQGLCKFTVTWDYEHDRYPPFIIKANCLEDRHPKQLLQWCQPISTRMWVLKRRKRKHCGRDNEEQWKWIWQKVFTACSWQTP